MKTTTFNGFIAVALLAILALAPLQFASANNGSTGGFFSNLRERQVTNREKVKTNLLQILSSDSAPAQTTAATPSSELANITYRLTDIADRIESRMLILENQGTFVTEASHTTLAMARTTLTNVSLQLASNTIDETAITADLAIVRSQLQKVIAELKTTLE